MRTRTISNLCSKNTIPHLSRGIIATTVGACPRPDPPKSRFCLIRSTALMRDNLCNYNYIYTYIYIYIYIEREREIEINMYIHIHTIYIYIYIYIYIHIYIHALRIQPQHRSPEALRSALFAETGAKTGRCMAPLRVAVGGAARLMNSFKNTLTPEPEQLCNCCSVRKPSEAAVRMCSSNAFKSRFPRSGSCSNVDRV